MDSERRALEEEQERLRAAVAAAAAGRDEVEARNKEAEAELARARSEIEAVREKDSQVFSLSNAHSISFLIFANLQLLCRCIGSPLPTGWVYADQGGCGG